jgi:hypothetical protein
MGGEYLPMPFWGGFTKKKLVIPHPLGGCRIAPTCDEGAVDQYGRVFDWHPGLVDGIGSRAVPGGTGRPEPRDLPIRATLHARPVGVTEEGTGTNPTSRN